MTIDFNVRKSAIALKELLLESIDIDRAILLAYNDLSPILDAAIDGSIELPISRVPRSYEFHEGELRKYSELVDVYSKFACLAKGLTIK